MRSAGRRSALALPLLLAASTGLANVQIRPPMCAADLGATVLDVSSYPAAYQSTYRHLILTKCGICHSVARAFNSPFLQLPAAEASAFSSAHRAAVADPEVLRVSPEVWNAYVKKMWKRPPCCNLCPSFSQAEAAAIRDFLVYDSKVRKTGDRLEAWIALRKNLIARYARYEAQDH